MGKRTKQYKRLMRQFEHLGFRQPYQLLMTSDIILDTLKLELITLFEKALSTKDLKPMITQCCIRALYEKNKGPKRDPNVVAAIERAKGFERRRCGHLMDEDPLSERECMLSVVDPKGNGQNKFRYIVATQDDDLRSRLRSIVPTPLMFVRRSVMILEPMSSTTEQVRIREELAKFREGIVRGPQKRKRDEEPGDDSAGEEGGGSQAGDGSVDKKASKKKKKNYGPKGPNPLATKKPKKQQPNAQHQSRNADEPTAEPSSEAKPRRKRRKKGDAPVSAENRPEPKVGETTPPAAATNSEA